MMRRSILCLANFEAIFMPALSPSMEKGTVVEWKKKVGDMVKEDDVFCTIQTDKAVVDYTNTFEPGYLARIFCDNGQSADVARTIAVMVAEEADIPKAANYVPDDAADASPATDTATATTATPTTAAATNAAASVEAAVSPTAPKRYGNSIKEAVAASGPSVMRIAAGLDGETLGSITPSGKGGRFVKADFSGQPGFDYNDADVTIKQKAASPSGSPADKGMAAATSVGSQAGNVYNVVISAGMVKKSIDDTAVLRKLIVTMPIPKPKGKKAAQ